MTTALKQEEPLSWAAVADAQDQVLARRQALAGALSAHAWDWRIATGRWRVVIPGVVVTHSGDPTDRQRAWAAVLHAGDGAALSGDAGLVELGFTLKSLTRLDIAIGPKRRAVGGALLGGPDLRVHRVTGLAAMVHPVTQPPVVHAHYAALHAAAWAPTDRAAEWRLAASVQQRLTTAPRLRAALKEQPRLPRRALMAAVLDDVELGAHAASELAFLRLCRRNGLPVPDELQVRVRANGTRYLDARYHRQRLVIELDGLQHKDVATWNADALRTLEVLAAGEAGERVVRLTLSNLRHDEADVARCLRILLGS